VYQAEEPQRFPTCGLQLVPGTGRDVHHVQRSDVHYFRSRQYPSLSAQDHNYVQMPVPFQGGMAAWAATRSLTKSADAGATQTGHLGNGIGEVGFADAGRPDEDDVGVFLDEIEPGRPQDEILVDALREIEVECVEGGKRKDGRAFDGHLGLALGLHTQLLAQQVVDQSMGESLLAMVLPLAASGWPHRLHLGRGLFMSAIDWPCCVAPTRSWNRLGARDTVPTIVRALVVALALLVVVPGVRAADQPRDVTTAHVRKATAAYNLGKYADAAKEYEAAYEQTLDPNLLFNIAQAYRLAGDREKAITAYRSFVRSAPQSEQRRLAESKMRELEGQRPAAHSATGSAPVAEPAPSAPAPAPAPTPLPMAPVTPPSQDRPVLGSVAPATPLAAAGEVTVPNPQPARFYGRWPFWTAVGAVVAGGVVLGIVLSRHSNDVTMPLSKYGTQEY